MACLPIGKEQGLGALIRQRLEDRRGIAGPRAVVESQHHLAFAQEIVGLELLEAETGPAGGIDFNHTGDAERIWIPAEWARRGGGIGTVGRWKCWRDLRAVEMRLVAPMALARCACTGIAREAIVPVTSTGSATFVSIAGAAGSRTVSARPSVKLITPTATVTAPAAAKTVILRITLSPRAQKPSFAV